MKNLYDKYVDELGLSKMSKGDFYYVSVYDDYMRLDGDSLLSIMNHLGIYEYLCDKYGKTEIDTLGVTPSNRDSVSTGVEILHFHGVLILEILHIIGNLKKGKNDEFTREG